MGRGHQGIAASLRSPGCISVRVDRHCSLLGWNGAQFTPAGGISVSRSLTGIHSQLFTRLLSRPLSRFFRGSTSRYTRGIEQFPRRGICLGNVQIGTRRFSRRLENPTGSPLRNQGRSFGKSASGMDSILPPTSRRFGRTRRGVHILAPTIAAPTVFSTASMRPNWASAGHSPERSLRCLPPQP